MDRQPDRLAWIALQVVDEAAEQAETGQVAPTLGLRLALAYLCSIADGPIFARPSQRDVFDCFWKAVAAPNGPGPPQMAAYARNILVDSCLQQIGRQTRFGPGIFATVREARSPEGRARRKIADALRISSEEEARKKWRKRQGYFGRPYPGDWKPGDGR